LSFQGHSLAALYRRADSGAGRCASGAMNGGIIGPDALKRLVLVGGILI
jgi:hypothetical protein